MGFCYSGRATTLMDAPIEPPPAPRAGDASTDPVAARFAEAVISDFHRELQSDKPGRKRSMAKKNVWGVQPLWVFGVGLVLAAGLLLRGEDRWILLGIGAFLLAVEVGFWRPIEAKRGLLEAVLSGAVAVTALARLAEAVDSTFRANHVYLILALVGALFLVIESVKRGAAPPEGER